MTDLIGRANELARLGELLESARRGTSGVVVVEGEAGLGKTSLLDATAGSATGFRVLRVDGVQSERSLPFAALHRLLIPVLDRLGELPAPQRSALEATFGASEVTPERFLVGLATLTLLTDVAVSEPLLCLVDDAQWIDAESLETISFVGRRLHADRVVLLIAMRGETDGRGPVPEGLPLLHLDGLGVDEARTLLAQVARSRVDDEVADRIVAESSGSPLALLEVASALTEDQLAGGRQLPSALPIGPRLESHFLDQVRALPADTQSFLLCAAADSSGDPAFVRRAARSLALSARAPDPAIDEGLLAMEPRVRFRHPLIRSAVYSGAEAEFRREAHRALADAVGEADTGARSWHLASSTIEPDDAIAAELARQADRADERGGCAAAAAFRARSAELTADLGTRSERFLEAARAHHLAGAPQAAEALLALAEPHLGNEPLRIEARRLHAALQSYSSPGGVPVILLEAAERLMPLDDAKAQEAFGEALQACLVSWQFTAGTTPAEVARVALASGLLVEPHDPVGRLHRGFALRFAGRYPEAIRDLRGALDGAVAPAFRIGGLERWAPMVNNVASDLWDLERGWALVQAMEAHERERGALDALRVTLGLVGYHAMWRGRFAESDAAHSEAAAISVALGEDAFAWELLKVELWAWQDDEERTLRMGELLTGELAAAYGAGIVCNIGRMALAVVHLAHGRYQEALDVAWPLLVDDVPSQGNHVLPSIVEAAIRCDARDAADAALARLAERAEAAGTPWALGVLARARALAAGDTSAEAYYRESIDHLRRSALPTELARSQLVYGEWLRRKARRTDARDQLREATDRFADMGASGFEQRARAELAATGGVTRRRRPATAHDLTPQELQIGRLAAAGNTNREIAAKLYISASTVDYHLRKVFQKLGLTSRRQLRSALS